eukprot:s2703_g9.t1
MFLKFKLDISRHKTSEVLKVLEGKRALMTAPDPFPQSAQYKSANCDEEPGEDDPAQTEKPCKKRKKKVKKSRKGPAQVAKAAKVNNPKAEPDVVVADFVPATADETYTPSRYAELRKHFVSEQMSTGLTWKCAQAEWNRSDLKRQLLSTAPAAFILLMVMLGQSPMIQQGAVENDFVEVFAGNAAVTLACWDKGLAELPAALRYLAGCRHFAPTGKWDMQPDEKKPKRKKKDINSAEIPESQPSEPAKPSKPSKPTAAKSKASKVKAKAKAKSAASATSQKPLKTKKVHEKNAQKSPPKAPRAKKDKKPKKKQPGNTDQEHQEKQPEVETPATECYVTRARKPPVPMDTVASDLKTPSRLVKASREIYKADGAAPTLPDTIPGDIAHAPDTLPATQPDELMQEEVQDAQSDHEMDVPKEDGEMDGVPLTDADADMLEENEKSMEKDEKNMDKDESVASTASLGPPWEQEFYDYKELENGKWVKYVKEKYVVLAKARGWALGPLDIKDAAFPAEKPLEVVRINQPTMASAPPPEPNTAPVAEPQQPDASTSGQKAPVDDDASMTSGQKASVDPGQPHTAPPPETPQQPDASMTPGQQPDTSAVKVADSQQLAKQATAAPMGPPDRTLELAGMQALMKGQVQREQAAALQEAQRVEEQRLLASQFPPADAVQEKIDWVSHKKEGMRLKRLMEESADGAAKFPYMAKMWAGSKEDRGYRRDRKQLLREWVHKNGDASSIEAAIVLSRSSSSKLGTQKELLTVAEMVTRGYPREKISAIVAKGGIPDPDCPHLPNLYKYWVQTSCVLKDVEEVRQESRVNVRCQASAAGVDALMSGPTGPRQRCALPSGSLEQMMQSVAPAAVPGLHVCISSDFSE